MPNGTSKKDSKVLERWYLKRTDLLANNIDKHYFIAVCAHANGISVETAWGRVGQTPQEKQRYYGKAKIAADTQAVGIVRTKIHKGYEQRPIGLDVVADSDLFKWVKAPDWFMTSEDDSFERKHYGMPAERPKKKKQQPVLNGMPAERPKKKKQQPVLSRPNADWNF